MDEMEYEAEIVTLRDEEGNDRNYEILDHVDYLENTYVVLLPDEEEADEVLILAVEGDGDDATLLPVEDEEILDKIFALFMERNA